MVFFKSLTSYPVWIFLFYSIWLGGGQFSWSVHPNLCTVNPPSCSQKRNNYITGKAAVESQIGETNRFSLMFKFDESFTKTGKRLLSHKHKTSLCSVLTFSFSSCKEHMYTKKRKKKGLYYFWVGGATDTTLIHMAVWSRISFPAVYKPFTEVSTHGQVCCFLSSHFPLWLATGFGMWHQKNTT